jgi:hypothetical protein
LIRDIICLAYIDSPLIRDITCLAYIDSSLNGLTAINTSPIFV